MAISDVIVTPSIVLATLNAKYIHAALGLRYLLANMGDLRAQTVLREFTIARPAPEIVDELLLTLGDASAEQGKQVVGFGVYIWNVQQTSAVIRLLRAQRPQIKIVLGGRKSVMSWMSRRSCSSPITSSPAGAISVLPAFAAPCCMGRVR